MKAAARETTRTEAGDHHSNTKDFTMFHRCRRRSGIDIKSKNSPPALHPSHMLRSCLPYCLLVLVLLLGSSQAASNDKERERRLEVSEGVPVDHQIGYIGDFDGIDSGPPYIIVAETGVETDLAIDQSTGEIRTKVKLDRETRASYSLVAIPLSGQNIRVVVTVKDENDNAPTFLQPSMHIEFPENTPREVKRTLLPARDLDLEPYNTQKYNIVSGNVNDAFRLSSHRERDGVLYLDLQISGFLDRETTPGYSLLIEALDGGSPPLRGFMTVNITIQDVNDNQPIFNQSRYFATVPENATVGTSVLQVYASDTDADENGLVEYAINRRQSDKEQMFRIDPRSGAIYINKPLDFETKELHELVVVAKDHGEQPLETTAFVSIRVTDVNDNQPTINVIFLSDDASPKISESAQPGEFVARISVHDPDSKTEYANVNVSLNGGDGHFALTTRDNSIYLVIVNLPLDREMVSNYTLSVVATDKGTPPLHASKSIFLRITDVNDNPPEFEQDLYHANVMEVADPGTSVLQVLAHDRDEGLNSALSYSLAETPETHAQWFQIDPQTGLITTRSHIDCETEPVPQLTVIAKDGGVPPLTSTATVLVTIHDVNDNEPIFDQSFYNVSVAENEPVGRCILKMCHRRSPDYSGNTYLGLHLGTDKFRALILDANLKAIYFSQVRYDVDLPEYGTKYGTVTDGGPMEFLACPVMWVKALDMLLNSLESQGADMHSIVAVSAAGQHHGCVFWSDLGLRRLCNLNPHLRLHEQLPESAFELIRSPTWRDTSTDKEVLEMTQAVGGSLEMAAITGSRTYARFTGPQIRKVFKQCPEHYERTPRISLLSSFVTSLLIGGMAAISVCDASGMNLLDLGQNKWSQKCLDACAPDLARRLRKPVASSQLQGHIADYYVKRWNFRPDCMVLTGTGSKGAELAGVLVEKDFIVISLDVSDTITMPLTKAPHLEEGHVMRHATRPDEFMGLLCFRNGLVARTIICEEVAKGNFDQFYAMLDATPKGNGGNLAVHFYDREILPISKGVLRWDPTMDNQQQECLRGVPSFETPEMEVRALLEGQIIHHCAISREMGFGPDPNTKVIVVGNDAKYHNLLQIVADVFNTPVYKRSGPEVCLLGSAFRARYAFYEHRERPCNCRACRRRGCREPKLSFHEFFRNVPSGLTLAAEPDPDSVKIYAPLFGRISQMCQLMGAQGAQFLDSKMNL